MENFNKFLKRKIEKLEEESLLFCASWEKFSSKPSEIGAKYLWLKYTLLKEDVPDDIMVKMIEAIEKDIKKHEKQRKRSDVLEEPFTRKSEICMLLDIALNEIEYLRQVLHSPKKKLNIKDQLLSVEN